MKLINLRKITIFVLIIYVSIILSCVYKSVQPVETLSFMISRMYPIKDNPDFVYNFSFMILVCIIYVPFGMLFPIACGKKCRNRTYCIGLSSVFVVELAKVFLFGGIISFDDYLFPFLGTVIGYSLHKPFISMFECRTRFLWSKENGKKSWIWLSLLLILFLSVGIFNSDYAKRISDVKNSFFNVLATSKTNMSSIDRTFEKDTDANQKEEQSERISFYDITYRAFSSFQKSAIYYGVNLNTDDLYHEFLEMLGDHPELFWLTGGGNHTLRTDNVFQIYELTPYTLNTDDNLENMEKQLLQMVDLIINNCKGSTEYEKAKWVHDYLVMNVEYDEGVLYKVITKSNERYSWDIAHTSYGAIINKRAACDGYAKAYKLLMDRLGIECGVVTGTATNTLGTDSHAWNYVKLDNQYFYVDVTWDDPINSTYDQSVDSVRHDYFCKTEKEMMADHKLDLEQKIPFELTKFEY